MISIIATGGDGGSSSDDGNDPADTFTNGLGMTFKLIPAGTFVMGSPVGEPGRDENETQHQVTLTQKFYMQTTEVTQGQWQKVMDNKPSWFSSCGVKCPVEQVSWEAVQEFIDTLNTRGGRVSYRLPTEAEWEYACRAGSTTAFANGEISGDVVDTDYDSNLDVMGWFLLNADYTTHPVAQKQPNAWGLYDMHGNVWEWCLDGYGRYPADSVIDPIGSTSRADRVVRGGSWYVNAQGCRSANRSNGSPEIRYNDGGFRLVALPVQEQTNE